MILPPKKTIREYCRKTGLLILIVLGLLSIVGTGDEEEDGGSNGAPTARIISPADNTTLTLGNQVTFTGSGTDPDEKTLKGNSLIWTSSINGHIGAGTSFTTGSLSKGTHLITLTATDNQGLADSTSITLTINLLNNNNTPPVATITSPQSGQTYSKGEFIQFSGTGYDTEDHWLTGMSLVWYSSKEATPLGTGESLTVNTLTGGTHTITLIATDNQGASHSDTISLIVRNTAPVATITYPPDGSTFRVGEAIPFVGSGFDDEDGDLTGPYLTWTAGPNILGNGETVTVSHLQAGQDIVVNLRVMDKDGLVDSDSITITIE